MDREPAKKITYATQQPIRSKKARNSIEGKEDGVGKDGTTNGDFPMYGSGNVEGAY